MVLHVWNHSQLWVDTNRGGMLSSLPDIQSDYYRETMSDLRPQLFNYITDRNYGLDHHQHPVFVDPIVVNWLKKDTDQMNLHQFRELSLSQKKYYLRVCLMLLASTKTLMKSVKENVSRISLFHTIASGLLGNDIVYKRTAESTMFKNPQELIQKLDLFGTDYSGWFTLKESETLIQKLLSVVEYKVLVCELVHRGLPISFDTCLEIGDFGALLYSIQEARANGFKVKPVFNKPLDDHIQSYACPAHFDSSEEKVQSYYTRHDKVDVDEVDTENSIPRSVSINDLRKKLEEYDENLLSEYVVINKNLLSESIPPTEYNRKYFEDLLARRQEECKNDIDMMKFIEPSFDPHHIEEEAEAFEEQEEEAFDEPAGFLSDPVEDQMNLIQTLIKQSEKEETLRKTQKCIYPELAIDFTRQFSEEMIKIINQSTSLKEKRQEEQQEEQEQQEQEEQEEQETEPNTASKFHDLIEEELNRRYSVSLTTQDIDLIRKEIEESDIDDDVETELSMLLKEHHENNFSSDEDA